MFSHASSQISGFSLGSPGSGGGVDADPGPDGEERQHERAAGQRQRLADRLPAEGEGPAARNHAEGPRVHGGGLSEGVCLYVCVCVCVCVWQREVQFKLFSRLHS